MNTNKIVKFATFLLVCSSLFGCGKDDNPSGGVNSGSGSIYGVVTDFATGNPVSSANVQLRPSGETTLTGYDGHYEFPNVPSGTYSIKVTKEGYSDLIDDYDIVVTNDKQTKRDVQIRKLPSSLHIYDNDSHEISELDFGADEGVTQKTFNIFNGGSQSLNYIITKTADWISNISQSTGTIGVGVTYPIVITINRELLADGNNSTTLLVTSSADGGKELTIKARKSSAGDGVYELPSAGLMVQMEDLGCVDWSSAKLLCENSTVAGYNDWRLPTKEELMTLYSNREMIGGFVAERYWSSSNNGTPYYVDFSNGIAGVYGSSNHYNVRAVRTYNGPTTLPTVSTSTPNAVTSHTAICGGNAVSHSGTTHVQLGVCYSNSPNPTTSSNTVMDAVTLGTDPVSFTCSLTGLSPSTTYHVRAFAINDAGTTYGEDVPFTTKGEFVELSSANLMVQTEDLGCVNWVSARMMCENSTIAYYSDWRLPTQDELMVLYNNRDYIGGFCTGYDQDKYKYWSSGKNTSDDPVGVSFYDGSLFWDYSSQEHSVRAVRNINGVSTTIPTVITSTPSNITAISASCGGNVTSDGGATVIQRGVCYGTSPNPTTSNMVVTGGSGTGSFSCSMTGLSAGTTYYVRAYAINSVGTSYGEQKQFTTTGGGGNGQTYSFDFEDSWQGWQVIDADGDENTWRWFYSTEGNIGHNGSVYTMGSESYINNVGALYPDNYLVSPQRYTVSNGAKISFYVCAQDADYPAEHYGIAISTASNPTANSFVTIWEETLSAKVRSGDIVRGNRTQGNWYLKTINLSAYAGQTIWVAIRHFGCTDQFVINVDDITIITGN